MKPKATKRNTQEYLLLALSAFATILIAPFIIIRFIRHDWLLATVDLVIVLSMLIIFIYVYQTRKTNIPGICLALLSACASGASINVKGADSIYWIYPSIIVIYYLIESKWASLLTVTLVISVVPVLTVGLDILVTVAILVSIFLTSLFGYIFSKTVSEKYRLLEELAIKDSLTGAGNRRALTNKIDEIVAIGKRDKSPVSLIMLDIDNFKAINDAYGHAIGDDVIVNIANILDNRIRETDALYRYGGEEFVIIPLNIGLELSTKVAENIRLLVESSNLIPKKAVTISLGVAEYKLGEAGEQWLKRADKALYQAKGAGRNQVSIAE